MKNIILIITVATVLFSCKSESEAAKEQSWQLEKSIEVEGVNAIGLALTDEGLWLSDGDHNRVVLLNDEGAITKSIDSLDRPMHIASNGTELFIPLYGEDAVYRYEPRQLNHILPSKIMLSDSLDAPAGVAVFGQSMAIADFYSNRIFFTANGDDWISFGKEGKAEGDFYYPTDVQITETEIWVADAYNNRVQVFDKEGNFKRVIGADQKMNAATGIFVSEDTLFVTDFENDRVLVFDHQGSLRQVISEKIEKPTDVQLIDGKLYIINYRNSLLNVFSWQDMPAQNLSENTVTEE